MWFALITLNPGTLQEQELRLGKKTAILLIPIPIPKAHLLCVQLPLLVRQRGSFVCGEGEDWGCEAQEGAVNTSCPGFGNSRAPPGTWIWELQSTSLHLDLGTPSATSAAFKSITKMKSK